MVFSSFLGRSRPWFRYLIFLNGYLTYCHTSKPECCRLPECNQSDKEFGLLERSHTKRFSKSQQRTPWPCYQPTSPGGILWDDNPAGHTKTTRLWPRWCPGSQKNLDKKSRLMMKCQYRRVYMSIYIYIYIYIYIFISYTLYTHKHDFIINIIIHSG